jgi:hypothetical protein
MNKKIILPILMIASLLTFMMLTRPDEIPLGFLLVPFIIITIIVFVSVNQLISFFVNDRASRKKVMVFSAILAVIAVNFLLLRSIGQLTLQDGIISIIITAVLGFYVSKFQTGH